MHAIAQLGLGFCIGYVAASLIESTMHQHVSDAPYKVVRLWERYPRIFKYFMRTRYSHHVVHHTKTFRQDFVTQFRSDAEREALDEELRHKGAHGRMILRSRYAVKLHGSGALVFVAPLLPAALLVNAAFSVPAAIGASMALLLPPLLSNFVHPYLHMPHEEAIRTAPRATAFLLRTWYFRAMARNHYMHHRYVVSNFNLLLGGDHIRRKYRRPSPKDLAEMARIGLVLH
jgi:hypothetical protein